MINYSFIIPHHNSPELLNRCLASIPEREDIQIIVVDDNSKEDKKPCMNRQGVEVIYIDAQHTKGAGRARNVGMSKATGKWLLFADCDDYYEEGFLDVLDVYEDKDVDVLYFNFNVKDSNGICNAPDNSLQKLVSSYLGDDQQLLQIKYRNNAPWDKMVKCSFVKEHNMYFEEVVNGNDVLFSLFVAYYSDNVMVEPKKLYNYIKNTNSLTNKKQSVAEIQCRVDHIIKHNAFNTFIGHPEWNSSPLRYALACLRSDISLFPVLPRTIWNAYYDKSFRDSWVKMFSNN